MARMHSTKSPMRRWPMAVWCNILDLAGVNAWILFSKETGRKISRWDFIHTLALDLINPEIERRRQIERPSAGPGCNVSRKRRNCAVRKGCKNNKTMEICRKCCKAMCGRCQALICIDCADDNVYNVAWSDVARVKWPAPPKACTKCGAKTAKKPY